MIEPLHISFYRRDTIEVARELLGKPFLRTIENRVISGHIVETEAYRSDDEACHAFKGLTKRTAPLFGEVGYTYVYLCYGIHFCLNIVARDTGITPAGGVLIRGIYECNLDCKSSRYNNGPGKSAAALSITIEHNGLNVTDISSPLIIGDGPRIPDSLVQVTPRIGISKSTDKLWRFYIKRSSKII